ncbi:MAG: SH3 domain-containing protein [Eubacteriales bacterium]|nr:SH3 domain-containing protein [Eubacteriales bacterium]
MRENRAGKESRTQERTSWRGGSSFLTLPFIVLCLFLFCISAFAGYQYTAVHDNGTVSERDAAMGAVKIIQNCNIREAPGTVSEVIGGGKEGDIYEYAGSTEITGEDSRWFSIRFEGGIGWVSEAVAELTID